MAVTFRSWTLQQWGIAIQQLGHAPQNLEQADNMADQWGSRPAPGSVKIVGGDYSADLEAAGSVFRWARAADRLEV